MLIYQIVLYLSFSRVKFTYKRVNPNKTNGIWWCSSKNGWIFPVGPIFYVSGAARKWISYMCKGIYVYMCVCVIPFGASWIEFWYFLCACGCLYINVWFNFDKVIEISTTFNNLCIGAPSLLTYCWTHLCMSSVSCREKECLSCQADPDKSPWHVACALVILLHLRWKAILLQAWGKENHGSSMPTKASFPSPVRPTFERQKHQLQYWLPQGKRWMEASPLGQCHTLTPDQWPNHVKPLDQKNQVIKVCCNILCTEGYIRGLPCGFPELATSKIAHSGEQLM